MESVRQNELATASRTVYAFKRKCGHKGDFAMDSNVVTTGFIWFVGVIAIGAMFLVGVPLPKWLGGRSSLVFAAVVLMVAVVAGFAGASHEASRQAASNAAASSR